MVVTGFFAQCMHTHYEQTSNGFKGRLTLKVLVTTIDALGHFETG